jgi:Thiamine pyrophosphate enzyme, C-terminal TPP binding domain
MLPELDRTAGVVVGDPFHGQQRCTAGLAQSAGLPGDPHKLWRTRDRKGYHVEYGYSCMGYEIAGGLGVKMAAPDREVYVLVGDGSYLMLSSELVTSVQERVKLVVILVQNHGFQSIGALSRSVGVQGFGTRYRYRDPRSGRLDGELLPVDLAANAASLGARVLRAGSVTELRDALAAARAADRTTVIHVETDPTVPSPGSDAWWDVPVAEVSALESARDARGGYASARSTRRSAPRAAVDRAGGALREGGGLLAGEGLLHPRGFHGGSRRRQPQAGRHNGGWSQRRQFRNCVRVAEDASAASSLDVRDGPRRGA